MITLNVYQMLIFVFKLQNNAGPKVLQNQFKLIQYKYVGGHRDQLCQKFWIDQWKIQKPILFSLQNFK